jgi:enamine deaminase RidA (YjgF/YER057c/UK114 family)
MSRRNIPSGASWEEEIGYSRAVRIGNTIEVAGTTATNGYEVVAKGDAFEQTRFIIQKIEQALKTAGASLSNVIRTRIYITDINNWQEVGKAHGEYFKDIKPASTMVAVSGLINPDHLVEIEATAVLDRDDNFLSHSAISQV